MEFQSVLRLLDRTVGVNVTRRSMTFARGRNSYLFLIENEITENNNFTDTVTAVCCFVFHFSAIYNDQKVETFDVCRRILVDFDGFWCISTDLGGSR